jgi:hypothetical protein
LIRIVLVFLAVIAVLLPSGDAHAYLDPGTGSIIVQGLIGAVAAALLVMKLYWQKLKGLFSSPASSQPSEAAAPKRGGRPTEPM